MNRSSETSTPSSVKYRVRDLAYTAAMVDGEGYITAGTRDARAEVGITNTDKRLMDFFLTTFGGSVQVRQPKNLSRKQWFVWRPEDGAKFLKLLLPHLKIKRSQALIAIGIFSTIGKGSSPARRQKLVRRLHALNNGDDTVHPLSRDED